MKTVSSAAFSILAYQAATVGANPHDWALLIYEESNWDPALPNHSGAPYYGLNQMGTAEMRAVGFQGTVPAGWLALSTEAQLPFVCRFFASKATSVGPVVLESAAHILAANFLPARVHGHADPDDVDYPLCQKGEGNNFYESNAIYDPGGKGTITIRDLGIFLGKKQTSNPNDTAVLTSGVNLALASIPGLSDRPTRANVIGPASSSGTVTIAEVDISAGEDDPTDPTLDGDGSRGAIGRASALLASAEGLGSRGAIIGGACLVAIIGGATYFLNR